MTYPERVKAMEEALEKAHHCVTIKVANSITDDVVYGYAFNGVMGVIPSLNNSFEIELSAPSYMELIKKVYHYHDDTLERTKFQHLFRDKRSVDVEVGNLRIHFTHQDIIHLLEEPIFAKLDENHVFLNYDTSRNFEKDFLECFIPQARPIMNPSIVQNQMEHMGWFIAYKEGE